MNDAYRGIVTLNAQLRVLVDDYLKMKLKEIGHDELIPSYGALLSLVFRNGGKVQIKDIYDKIPKNKSTITEMINRLVKLKYLVKVTCSEDKRVSYVVVTEKAIELQPFFQEISVELLTLFFQGFDEEEKIKFAELMKKAINNFT